MSLINDALTKIEAERAEKAAVKAGRLSRQIVAEKWVGQRRVARRRKSLRSALVGASILLVVFAIPVAVLVWRDLPAPAAASAPVAAPAKPSPSVAAAATAPREHHPVPQPPAAAPATPAPAPPRYVLSGMTALGPATLLGVTRLSDHHSIWVQVGQTVGEVTAVSYDPAKDEAVIRVNGQDLTIGLDTGSEPAAHAAE